MHTDPDAAFPARGSTRSIGAERAPALRLMHLCDSLFPVGAFAYSDGLEAAVAGGLVRGAAGLREWMATCLDDTIARCEAPAAAVAWAAVSEDDWPRLVTVDEELHAIRPAAEARQASRALGLRLLRAWSAIHPAPQLEHARALADAGTIRPALPVAFACACASSGVDCRTTLEAYAYTRLAATVSAAMRVLSVGHTDAHRLLAETLGDVPSTVDGVLAAPLRVESFVPAADIAAMTHRYLHSRLFRS
jgi:urease accessory protein